MTNSKGIISYRRAIGNESSFCLQIHLCPNDKQDTCNLALVQVNRPYIHSREISWLRIGNGKPPESSFKVHLCGWGAKSKQNAMLTTQNLAKNFVLNVEILPPAQCPPSRKC